jgi:hypothetical protein
VRRVGLCRGAAIQNSPGFQPWVRWSVKGALKVAPDVGRAGGITPEEPKNAPRPPLSGRISRYAIPRVKTLDPGLKPWAVLYSRFAAKLSFVICHSPGPLLV